MTRYMLLANAVMTANGGVVRPRAAIRVCLTRLWVLNERC